MHRVVPEHDERRRRRLPDEADPGPQDRGQGPLGPREQARERRPGGSAGLGQQVFEGVPGDLAAERPERRADQPQVRRGDGAQLLEQLGGRGVGPVPAAVPVEDLERDDVVRRAPVGQRVRAAGVVADHAADGAAGVRGGVRPEPQPVRSGLALQVVEDHARFDEGRHALGVDLQDAVQVAGEVEDDAGPDGVAGDGRARTAGGEGDAELAADAPHGDDVLDRAGEDDDERDDAVVRGVGRVLGAAAAGRVDGAGPRGRPQGGRRERRPAPRSWWSSPPPWPGRARRR